MLSGSPIQGRRKVLKACKYRQDTRRDIPSLSDCLREVFQYWKLVLRRMRHNTFGSRLDRGYDLNKGFFEINFVMAKDEVQKPKE